MKKIFIWFITSLVLCTTAHAQNESDLRLEIYQIRVSIGHATLVVVKHKTTNEVYSSTLIDTGVSKDDGQLIVDVIQQHAASRLDRILLTHLDGDHIAGLGAGVDSRGVLAERCDPVNGKIRNPNRKLQLIYNLTRAAPGAIDNAAAFDRLLDIAEYQPYYTKMDWAKNLDFYLGPFDSPAWDAIQLKTLAVDGYMRKLNDTQLELGKDVTAGKNSNAKNNVSGVLTIVWGKFSFLIQGDMQASKEMKFQVARTVSYYRDQHIVPEWEIRDLGDPNSQLAKNKRATKNQNPPVSKDEFVRKTLRTEDASQKPFSSFRNDPYANFVASPNKWHHDLGRVIKDYNNFDEPIKRAYAHACVALVPHHGAMTSNLWFDSNHAIFGTPYNNHHGHPNMQAIMATLNTGQANNLYFTHLSDHHDHNRLTELSELKHYNGLQIIAGIDANVSSLSLGVGSAYDQSKSTYTTPPPLNTIDDPTNGDFFLVSVEHDGRFEISSGVKDAATKTAIGTRGLAACERRH